MAVVWDESRGVYVTLSPTENVLKMLREGKNLHGHKLTERQHRALVVRMHKIQEREKRAKAKNDAYCGRPCPSCYSGIVPWNQGSEYCSGCIKRKG